MGADVLHGVRRVIGLVCRRTHRCSGRHVLADVERLGRRLRKHPLTFTAHSPLGRVKLTLGERELAAVTFGGGRPEVYGLLPAAVEAALDHDYALLKRFVFADRAGLVAALMSDPAQSSMAAAAATSCHDYPRPYDLAAPPADRRSQYRRALAALDPAQFRPFSPRAWLSTGIDAGPGCLDWPADPTAGSPLQGRPLREVPVLVQSGDLDTNTPVEQGRVAAAQFPHATFAVVANAGHTPDAGACGAASGPPGRPVWPGLTLIRGQTSPGRRRSRCLSYARSRTEHSLGLSLTFLGAILDPRRSAGYDSEGGSFRPKRSANSSYL